jgi:RNA polymerase-binding transcription factor DksA
MKETDLDPIRHQLLELAQRLRGDVGTLTAEVYCGTETQSSGNLTNVPVEDRAERGSESSDDDVTIGLLELESARLGEVNAALDRLDRGTFGRCEDCARGIARDRLRAIPFARRCIACARAAQQGRHTPQGNL